MDDQSFDRLARAVSGLRDRTSRRGALKALLGGALAVPALTAAGDAEAKKRKNRRKWWNGNRCRTYGQRCNSNGQCCNGSCYRGVCMYGVPGQTCGNQTCVTGWECCRSGNGNHICTPAGYGACCDGSSWPTGSKCCHGGIACSGSNKCCGVGCCTSDTRCCGSTCCPKNMQCCGSTCCPKGDGWRCNGGTCGLRRGAVAADGVGPIDGIAPTPPDPADSIPVSPGDGEA